MYLFLFRRGLALAAGCALGPLLALLATGSPAAWFMRSALPCQYCSHRCSSSMPSIASWICSPEDCHRTEAEVLLGRLQCMGAVQMSCDSTRTFP